MLYKDVLEQLAHGHSAGVTVVTPNQRLAQTLRRDFDAAQLARGLPAWETADILPFGAFVARLWEDTLYSDAAAGLPLLLTPTQEQTLWEHVIRSSTLAETLLSVAAAASQCREAWQLAHAWRLGPKLAGSAPALTASEDTRAFLEWAARYEHRTQQERQIETARLPDALIPLLDGARALRLPKCLVMFGFDTVTPQQTHLLEVMARRGVAVTASQREPQASTACRLEFTSAKEELLTAARWGRARFEASGANARIGIVVPDLAQSRDQVRRTLAAVLAPDSLLPAGLAGSGTAADDPTLSPEPPALPFDLSLGLPLTDYPLVNDALLALRLAGSHVAFEDASRVIRSPFLAGAESERADRARLDAQVRERSGATLTLGRLLRLMRLPGMPAAPGLLERFLRLDEWLACVSSGPKAAPEWAQLFANVLRLLGFPGERTLDSHEYQTLKKWHAALASLATLERVTGKMSGEQALGRLQRLTADTLFQPQTPEAPIAVLGVLESAGLAFDHLWITGLTDETWPLPARPNPFIPIRLQREAGIAQVDAAASLERGRRMTQDWSVAAREVVFSHARMQEDSELAPSPLIAAMPVTAIAALGIPPYETLCDAIHRAGRQAGGLQERLIDDRGPPLSPGEVFSGGTAVFRDQAACPFRSFARHRLDSTVPKTPQPGLTPADRGTLLHHLFAAVWTTLKDKARLDALDAATLGELLETCALEAIAKIRRLRPDAMDERFALLEKDRLVRIAREWLAIEKARPDFQVAAVEHKQTVSFGGVTVNAKLDRLDELASGEKVVIDYKTGRCAVSAWLGPRPDEPQLPLYALGGRTAVSAVAFAQLKTGELKFKGLAETEGLLPGVTRITKDRSKLAKQYANWDEVVQGWRAELDALGRGFAAGDARVDPKAGEQTCQHCDQQPFCRIAEKALPEAEEEGTDE